MHNDVGDSHDFDKIRGKSEPKMQKEIAELKEFPGRVCPLTF